MTTSEKLRRRQRRTGIFLIILAMFSVAYAVWDGERAEDRDACIASSFADNNEIQQTKSNLAQRASDLQALIDANQDAAIDVQTQVVKDVAAAQDTDEVLQAFADFNERSDDLEQQQKILVRQQAQLLQLRKDTKTPPFPTGKCE